MTTTRAIHIIGSSASGPEHLTPTLRAYAGTPANADAPVTATTGRMVGPHRPDGRTRPAGWSDHNGRIVRPQRPDGRGRSGLGVQATGVLLQGGVDAQGA